MVSTEQFDKKYKGLNKAQKEAVDAIYGPVMVVAGPGTGKTTLLTIRIANILKQTDTRPEQILALTFTDSGVKAMKEKLKAIIGSDALKVHIMTYHSFAEQILRRYNDYFAEFNNFRFISEDDAITLFEEIIDKGNFERISSTFSPFFQVKNIIGYIKNLKREFVDPVALRTLISDYETTLKDDPENYSKTGKTKGEIKQSALSKFKKVDKMRELATAFLLYEEWKKKLKYYDFEDVINEVVKKVEANKELQYEIAEEYQFILADEHQDANRSQNKILDFFSIVDESPNLMVVGDEKQAIFRFQGGTLENFVGFQERYPNAKYIILGENYRSHQNILDYSFDLMSKKAHLLLNKDNLLSKGAEVGDGHIEFITLFDKESECEYIGEQVKEIVEKDVAATIAIIYRQNKEKDGMAKLLDVLAVPYIAHSDNELFDDRYALEFISLVKAVSDFYDNQSMVKMLSGSMWNISIEKIHALNRDISQTGRTAYDLISKSEDEELLAVAAKIKHLSEFGMKTDPIVFIEEAARTTSFLTTTDATVLDRKLAILRAFADMARQVKERKETADIKDLANFIDKAIEYDVKVTIPKDLREANVNLMTAHKSKGLEFDYVFIMNLTESDWGGSKHRQDFVALTDLLQIVAADKHDDVEDARKLLYVAMTRARKHLVMTFPRYRMDGKENDESGFIGEIRTDLVVRKEIDKKATLTFLKSALPKETVEFYRGLFLSQSFSVTALNNYLECPNQYLFCNLLKFPFAESLSLYVGNAVHAALETYFNLILRKKEHSPELFYSLFERNIEKAPLREKEKQAVLKDYRDSLLDFATHNGLSDDEFYKAEYRIDTAYPVDYEAEHHDVQIRGSVDRVDKKGDELYVIDFKTGKVKTKNEVAGLTKDANGNYLRQIVFYKMVLEMMDKENQVNRGQVHFILQDENNGKRVAHEFELTDEMVSVLKIEMEKAFTEILSGEFLVKGCGEEDCEYCKMRSGLGI